MSLVGLVGVEEQNMPLKRAIEKCLNLIQFQFDQDVQKVAIKPNLCYYWDYSTGETTDPRFVGALIELVRNHVSSFVEISVVESDASAMRCKYVFKMLGYEKMAKEKNVKLINLTREQAKKVNVKTGTKHFQFSVPKTIADADLLINVPKIKYMQQVKISCALKNTYGCNPYPKKFIYHKWLDEAIVSLNKIMRPDLCVLDGVVAKGIKTLKLALVMASIDPVAMDAAASEIAGINPRSVKHIVLAHKEKIGSIDFVPKGQPLAHFQNLFPRKTLKYKIRRSIATLYNRFPSSNPK